MKVNNQPSMDPETRNNESILVYIVIPREYHFLKDISLLILYQSNKKFILFLHIIDHLCKMSLIHH